MSGFPKAAPTGVIASTITRNAVNPLPPTVAAGAALGTSPPAPTLDALASDFSGSIFYGTGTTPVGGAMGLVFTFGTPKASADYTVQLTPGRIAANINGGIQIVSKGTTGFSIYFLSAQAGSIAAGALTIDYTVID